MVDKNIVIVGAMAIVCLLLSRLLKKYEPLFAKFYAIYVIIVFAIYVIYRVLFEL